MAQLTWYIQDSSLGNGIVASLTPPGTATLTNTGWQVGDQGPSYCLMSSGNANENNFTSTLPSVDQSDTVTFTSSIGSNDFRRNTINVPGGLFPGPFPVLANRGGIFLETPYNANFGTGSWQLAVSVRADRRNWFTGATGRVIAKMYKAIFSDTGTALRFTQISDTTDGTGWVPGTTITSLNDTTEQSSTITFSPTTDVILDGNYDRYSVTGPISGFLFFALTWEITNNGNNSRRARRADAVIMQGTNLNGNGSTIVSPTFKKRIAITTQDINNGIRFSLITSSE